jgi:hypothetical protein
MIAIAIGLPSLHLFFSSNEAFRIAPQRLGPVLYFVLRRTALPAGMHSSPYPSKYGPRLTSPGLLSCLLAGHLSFQVQLIFNCQGVYKSKVKGIFKYSWFKVGRRGSLTCEDRRWSTQSRPTGHWGKCTATPGPKSTAAQGRAGY